MKCNKYKIKRDHNSETGFFVVNVQEINQYGFGFQVNVKGFLYGISITNK